MIPVGDKVRQRLLQAVESELDQLRIEKNIPAAVSLHKEGMMTDDDYASVILEFELIQLDLLDNRLVVFDVRPQCGIGKCGAVGRYGPIIFVFLPSSDTPIAQLEVQPPQRCCTQHADGRLDKYLNTKQWGEIQAQVAKQAKEFVRFNDAKIMYMDYETGQIVPPPTPAIHIVDKLPLPPKRAN